MASRIAVRICWPLAAVMGFGACDPAAAPRDAGIDDAGPREGAADIVGEPVDGSVSMCTSSRGTLQVAVALEHVDCVSRPIIDCTGTESASAPESTLMVLLMDACRLPSYHWVRVDFESGCPTALEVRSLSQTSAELVPCLIANLSVQRWRCALEASCALVEWDTLALP